MWSDLFSSVDLLKNGLDASWQRNEVIRNNLANAQTPDFKASDVEFESLFASALEGGSFSGKTTRDKHIDIGSAGSLFDVESSVVQQSSTSMLMNGNNVDIEAENVALAQNSMLYNTLIEKVNGELARLRLAISEGR